MAIKKIFLSLFTCAFIFPALAFAATLGVTANPASVVVGQSFRADVTLDTNGDSVNAIQGEIVFPPNIFSFQGVNDGDSPVSLWIEAPHEISSGTIAFSGIVPGGFTGSAKSVVGIMLAPIAAGTGDIAINGATLLRNDGLGSAITTTSTDQVVAVAAPVGVTMLPPPASSTRFTVPESFTPIVAEDQNIYNGAHFLVFSTTDKGSGIDHYEVLEVPAGSAIGQDPAWVTATSPYLLKDQALSSDIYVRAVDNNGNVTVAKLPARFSSNNVSSAMIFLGIGLLALVVCALIFFFLMRSKRKKRAANAV